MFGSKRAQILSIDREMDKIMDSMRILDPVAQEVDYVILMQRYHELADIKKELENKKGVNPGIFIDVAKLGVAAIGTMFVPVMLAKIAYTNDKELNLCDGRIWNLIGKNYNSKT